VWRADCESASSGEERERNRCNSRWRKKERLDFRKEEEYIPIGRHCTIRARQKGRAHLRRFKKGSPRKGGETCSNRGCVGARTPTGRRSKEKKAYREGHGPLTLGRATIGCSREVDGKSPPELRYGRERKGPAQARVEVLRALAWPRGKIRVLGSAGERKRGGSSISSAAWSRKVSIEIYRIRASTSKQRDSLPHTFYSRDVMRGEK